MVRVNPAFHVMAFRLVAILMKYKDMKNFKYYLPFILTGLILVLLNSCEAYRAKICRTCPTKDSIVVKIRDVEKEVRIHDTVQIRSFLPNPCAAMCDSMGKVKKGFIETVPTDKGTTTTLEEKDGGIEDITGINGIQVNATVRDTCESKYITTPSNCTKEHRTDFDGFCRWFFYIVSGLILVFVAVKVLKAYFKV